jgi:hypothetical protein
MINIAIARIIFIPQSTPWVEIQVVTFSMSTPSLLFG